MSFSERRKSFFQFFTFILISASVNFVEAQVSLEEHEKHHPAADVQPSNVPTKSATAGMAGMGDMMKGMMGPTAEKEFYPSLMKLPNLSNEIYLDLKLKADDRMKSGASIMNQALIDLINGAKANDYAIMKTATAQLREGLGMFESGIATHEALAAGKSPQSMALSWFKENLSLIETQKPSEKMFFGLGLFHFFIMSLLFIFSMLMIVMYFYKMKRATNLLSWLQNKSQNLAQNLSDTNSSVPDKINLSSNWKGKLKIATIKNETPSAKTFRLISPDGKDLPFTYLAGQFMTLSVVIDGKPLKRAYTISSHPCDQQMLEITIKREENGLVSRYLHDVIHEGDLIDIEAASGNLTFSGVGEGGIVLIGGGVGITPLMSVLRCLISCGMRNKIYLLYACKSTEEIIYREELLKLQARNQNLKLVIAVEKKQGDFPGVYQGRLTTEKIFEAVPNIADLRVHLCGPPLMMTAIRASLTELHVPVSQIKEEAFGPAMKPAVEENKSQNIAVDADNANIKKVTFKKSGKTVNIQENETVLELSESSGIEIPFQCRVGTCGICKVQLLSGEVSMEVQDALSADEKASKIILACQAKARSDLQIDEP